MSKEIKTVDLFNCEVSYINPLLNEEYPWQILPKIKDFLSKHKDDFNTKEIFKDENFLEHYVLGMISNLAGDMVESGQYHFYRGVLTQEGKDLLKIYDFAMTRLVQLGANNPDGKPMTMNYVAEQRQIINENIASVG